MEKWTAALALGTALMLSACADGPRASGGTAAGPAAMERTDEIGFDDNTVGIDNDFIGFGKGPASIDDEFEAGIGP